MITQSELKEILNYDADTGIFTWKVNVGCRAKAGNVAGSVDKYGYIRIKINGKDYFLHRLAWLYVYGEMPKLGIDHVNGKKADNRINNIRQATASQNKQNIIKPQLNNVSKLLGVSFRKSRNKFQAQISVNKKNIYIGLFKTHEESHEAYLKAKRELHEFCTI